MKRGSRTCAYVGAVAAALSLSPAQAAGFSVLHNFNGTTDGGNPVDGFAMGPTGILYGAAPTGGASGNGVVFRVMGNGRETVLHSFAGGADGAAPNGGVILGSDGSVFGTTTAGGTAGNGTVFRIKGTNKNVLYSFAGGVDGIAPQAGLTMDAAGNLYGTTVAGGASGNGTVFELVKPTKKNAPWKEVVLYSFGKGKDGAAPLSGVTFDAAGNLYGTTSLGGANNFGTVFRLTPGAKWTETTLQNFRAMDDGAYPYGGLISDATGNLYGTTTMGGTGGGGTIFKLTPSGGSWTFSTIYGLPGWGISGSFRNLVLDDAGNIFGTTHCDGDNNSGTVFKLSPTGGSWNYTLLYTFTGGIDGQFTISNLVIKGGSLYGTTQYGGANGAGTIYKLTP